MLSKIYLNKFMYIYSFVLFICCLCLLSYKPLNSGITMYRASDNASVMTRRLSVSFNSFLKNEFIYMYEK